MGKKIVDLEADILHPKFEQPSLVAPTNFMDERGWLQRRFGQFNMDSMISTMNTVSKTWRGFHYQEEPHAQAKLVTCIRGQLLDYVVDIRKGSDTYMQISKAYLSGENRHVLFVPKGFAHGYLTIAPNTEVLYLIDGPRVENAERGIRWNDWNLAVDFQRPDVMSERDRTWGDFQP